jgi:flagellar protein FlgJ
MTKPVADASVYTNLGGLAALKSDARAQDPSALRETAKQFESIFAKMVLSSMRQASSSFGDSLMGSSQQDFYQGMFDDQLAVELTKGKGLGLADMLVRQLTQSGMVPKEAANVGSAGGAGTDASASGVGGGSAEQRRGLPMTDISGAKKTALPMTSGATPSGTTSAADAAGKSATLPFGAPDKSGTSTTASVQTPEDFIKEIWPCAQEAAEQLGVDPRHLIAQAALETGWGQSLPCDAQGNNSFNLFGIKAGQSWSGDSVTVKTLEFEGGVPMPKQAKFRAYGSAAESFKDYVSLLRDNPRYADALNTGSDTNAFATALQRGGYATDPAYAQKIAAISQNLGARAPISETALKSSTGAPITTPIATR